MDANEKIRQVTNVATPATGLGTAAGDFFGFLNEYGVAIGVLISFVSLCISIYLGVREDRRREKEYKELVRTANQAMKK